jgi:hypothetical protein
MVAAGGVRRAQGKSAPHKRGEGQHRRHRRPPGEAPGQANDGGEGGGWQAQRGGYFRGGGVKAINAVCVCNRASSVRQRAGVVGGVLFFVACGARTGKKAVWEKDTRSRKGEGR